MQESKELPVSPQVTPVVSFGSAGLDNEFFHVLKTASGHVTSRPVCRLPESPAPARAGRIALRVAPGPNWDSNQSDSANGDPGVHPFFCHGLIVDASHT